MLKQSEAIPTAGRTRRGHAGITYDEFLAGDFGGPHVEWVNGEVVMMAPVSNDHSAEQIFLVKVLGLWADANDLGEIRAEPFQMKTGPGLPGRSPDVMFVAKKNVARLKKTHLAGPADLVVEIISPGSQGLDRGEKYYEYEKGGVPEYWMVDTLRKRADFHVLGPDGHYRAAPTDGGVYRSTAMKGLWIKLSWLWQRPLPSLLTVQKAWKLI